MVLIMSNMQPMLQIINKVNKLNFSELLSIDYWQPSRVFPAESIGYEISEFPFFWGFDCKLEDVIRTKAF